MRRVTLSPHYVIARRFRSLYQLDSIVLETKAREGACGRDRFDLRVADFGCRTNLT